MKIILEREQEDWTWQVTGGDCGLFEQNVEAFLDKALGAHLQTTEVELFVGPGDRQNPRVVEFYFRATDDRDISIYEVFYMPRVGFFRGHLLALCDEFEALIPPGSSFHIVFPSVVGKNA